MKNKIVLKEEDLHRIIEDIVRQTLTEEELNERKRLTKLGKHVAGALTGLGLAGLIASNAKVSNGPDYDPDMEAKNKQEILNNVHKNDSYKATKANEKTKTDAFNESKVFTEQELKMIVSETINNILKKNSLINEAGKLQAFKSGFKAIGQGAFGRNGGVRANFRNNMVNYDKQNANDAMNKYNTEVLDLQREYKAKIKAAQAQGEDISEIEREYAKKAAQLENSKYRKKWDDSMISAQDNLAKLKNHDTKGKFSGTTINPKQMTQIYDYANFNGKNGYYYYQNVPPRNQGQTGQTTKNNGKWYNPMSWFSSKKSQGQQQGQQGQQTPQTVEEIDRQIQTLQQQKEWLQLHNAS